MEYQKNYEENFICSTNYFYIDYTEQQKIQIPGRKFFSHLSYENKYERRRSTGRKVEKFVLMSGDGYKKYKTEEKILIKGGIT